MALSVPSSWPYQGPQGLSPLPSPNQTRSPLIFEKTVTDSLLDSGSPQKKRLRRKRCMECAGCLLQTNCGTCSACVVNSPCKQRKCEELKRKPHSSKSTPQKVAQPSFFPVQTSTPVVAPAGSAAPLHSVLGTGSFGEVEPPKEKKKKKNTRPALPKEATPCGCPGSDDGIFYTHLGASGTPEGLRALLESRFHVTGNALRMIELEYTGKEAKTVNGCPTAEYVVRRLKDELFMVLYRHHRGHTCDTSYTVVSIVFWDCVSADTLEHIYDYLTDVLPEYGTPTERQCSRNDSKTCGCQGEDSENRGASYSFGCTWVVYYNGCKFAKSQEPRKFKLTDESKEESLKEMVHKLSDNIGPVYKLLAPEAHKNQVATQEAGQECRLGDASEKPFSGITCCMDFCAHSHYDKQNLPNGEATVVLTILNPRLHDRNPEDEQLHVLPLYRLRHAPTSSIEGIEVRPVETMAPPSAPPPPPNESSLHPLPISHMVPQAMYFQCTSNMAVAPPPANLSHPPPLSTHCHTSPYPPSFIQAPPPFHQAPPLPVHNQHLPRPQDQGQTSPFYQEGTPHRMQQPYIGMPPLRTLNHATPISAPSPNMTQWVPQQNASNGYVQRLPELQRLSCDPCNGYGIPGYSSTPGGVHYVAQESTLSDTDSGCCITPNSSMQESPGSCHSSSSPTPHNPLAFSPPGSSASDTHDLTRPPPLVPMTTFSQSVHTSEDSGMVDTSAAEPCIASSTTSTFSSTPTQPNLSHRIQATPGGVAMALTHGSLLIECARKELHATTPVKNPCRRKPTRISIVFYQHKGLMKRHHGWFEEVEKRKQRKAQAEEQNEECGEDKEEEEEEEEEELVDTKPIIPLAQPQNFGGRVIQFNPPPRSVATSITPATDTLEAMFSCSSDCFDGSPLLVNGMLRFDDIVGMVPNALQLQQFENGPFYLEFPIQKVDRDEKRIVPVQIQQQYYPCQFVSETTSFTNTLSFSNTRPNMFLSGNFSRWL
eukprot:Em0019g1209a